MNNRFRPILPIETEAVFRLGGSRVRLYGLARRVKEGKVQGRVRRVRRVKGKV